MKVVVSELVAGSCEQDVIISVMPELGGQGVPPPPIFGRSVNPIQPGRADYPHLLQLAPPKFFTFRHDCIWHEY